MKRILPLIILLSSMMLCAPAWSAGLWLYEGGTPDVGTATAGRAALANDASTAAANPAGMTRLEAPICCWGFSPYSCGPIRRRRRYHYGRQQRW